MSWEGSSNIGPNGFTIDLGGLKEVELKDDGKTVSIAPGLKWSEVYGFLKPHGLHTVGGRSSGVGVGGFLIGGKLTYPPWHMKSLSPSYHRWCLLPVN